MDQIYKNSPLSKFTQKKKEFLECNIDTQQTDLFSILTDLLQETISTEIEQLKLIISILENINFGSIPENLPSALVNQILLKYQESNNQIFYEKALILSLECFSVIDDYANTLVSSGVFEILLSKIQNSSPQSYLIFKILANVFDHLTNKVESVRVICSLTPNLLQFFDINIFDYWFQFIYNFISQNALPSKEDLTVILESINFLLQHLVTITLSDFSFTIFCWILYKIIKNYDINLDLILDHPVFKKKEKYLYNSESPDLPVAYIQLAGNLFIKGFNKFDLHILDFPPLFRNHNSETKASSIWILTTMINSSHDMVDEFKEIGLKVFENVYSLEDFSGKIEISYLYQVVLDNLYEPEYFNFFKSNASLLFQFFDLRKSKFTKHMFSFIYDTYNIVYPDEEKVEEFLNILNENNLILILNEFENEHEGDNVELIIIKQLASLFEPNDENDFLA